MLLRCYSDAKEGVNALLFNPLEEVLLNTVHKDRLGPLLVRKVDALKTSDRFMNAVMQPTVSKKKSFIMTFATSVKWNMGKIEEESCLERTLEPEFKIHNNMRRKSGRSSKVKPEGMTTPTFTGRKTTYDTKCKDIPECHEEWSQKESIHWFPNRQRKYSNPTSKALHTRKIRQMIP